MSDSMRAQSLLSDIRGRIAAPPAWAGLIAIFLASVLARYLLGRRDPGPWIFIDEIIYSELGRSVADDLEFSIRGAPTTGYGFVYPILIAPSYALFDSLASAYAAVKITNAVVMSLTVVPVYFLARRLMRPALALAAGLLSVAIPAMTYTSVVMTENAFYPAFALALLAIVAVLERPTKLNQLLVIGALVLAFLIRAQGAALFVAYIAGILVFALLESADSGRGVRGVFSRLRAYWPTWLGGIVVVVIFLVAQLARGGSLRQPLGAYGVVADGERYSLVEVCRWFLYHIAELDLWTGIIPLAALVILCGCAVRRGSDRSERAFVAAAVPALFFLTLVVAAFASQSHENRIEERNLFYVGILLFVALMWWVDRGLPRPQRLTAIAFIVAAALPGVIPYGEFINQTAISDTFGLLPLWGLQERVVAPNHVAAMVLLAAVVAATIMVMLPRRLALLAPMLVLGYLALAHSPIEHRTSSTSRAVMFEGIRTSPDWIDASVGRDARVAALWTATLGPQTMWLNEFFNRSVGQVYYLDSPLPGNLSETGLQLDPATGQLLLPSGELAFTEYVLVDSQTDLIGEIVAEDGQRGMQVVQVDGPLTIGARITGVYSDRWTEPEVTYTRFACAGGEVEISMISDPGIHAEPQTVVAFAGDRELASVTFDPSESASLVVPLVPTDGACAVRLMISPTVVPAEIRGTFDMRPLGVLVQAFDYRGP